MTDRLLDVNVLLALADPRHLHHNAAHQWFTGVTCFATTPLTEVAFVRLMSHPKVGGETPATALGLLHGIRALDTHRFVTDDGSLAEPTIDVVGMVGHRQVTDWHLANLAASKGLILATFDARLSRSLPSAEREHVEVIAI